MGPMFNVGGGEILMVLVVALLVLGPERLPGAARSVGRAIAQLRQMSAGVQSEFREAFDADELREGLAAVRQVTNLGSAMRSELFSAANSFGTSPDSSTQEPGHSTYSQPPSNGSSYGSGQKVTPPDGVYAEDRIPSTGGYQVVGPRADLVDILLDPTDS